MDEQQFDRLIQVIASGFAAIATAITKVAVKELDGDALDEAHAVWDEAIWRQSRS